MGRLGREIIETDVKAVVKALRAAYADEWLAHYYFLHAAQVATGLNAPPVIALLKTKATDELGHAQLVGERILELGGELPSDWAEIPQLANGKKFTMPKNNSDVKGILKAALAVERCAIGVYQNLLKSTLHKDSVTQELAETLLSDEVKDEEEIENLIGD